MKQSWTDMEASPGYVTTMKRARTIPETGNTARFELPPHSLRVPVAFS